MSVPKMTASEQWTCRRRCRCRADIEPYLDAVAGEGAGSVRPIGLVALGMHLARAGQTTKKNPLVMAVRPPPPLPPLHWCGALVEVAAATALLALALALTAPGGCCVARFLVMVMVVLPIMPHAHDNCPGSSSTPAEAYAIRM